MSSTVLVQKEHPIGRNHGDHNEYRKVGLKEGLPKNAEEPQDGQRADREDDDTDESIAYHVESELSNSAMLVNTTLMARLIRPMTMNFIRRSPYSLLLVSRQHGQVQGKNIRKW